jgi:general secretion pathway protein F
MPSATLAQFIALNDQLIALVHAGVPVNLGITGERGDAAAALDRIGATVARRVGEGLSLDQAVSDAAVPAAYRSVVLVALRTGNLSAALDEASSSAESIEHLRHAVRFSLLYPLMIATLAYAGLVLFCWYFVPTLENIYRDARLAPGSGLRVLQALRETLPYWIAIPPLALLLVAIWSRLGSRPTTASARPSGILSWIPAAGRVSFENRRAVFAETLASLLEAEVSLPEAIRLAAPAWEDEGLQREMLDMATAEERGTLSSDGSGGAQLPPFLRWAIWHGDESIGRPRGLRMAARTYREAAQRRVDRLRLAAPVITCVVLGGGLTLLYGLALFVPMAQLLRSLAF